MLWHDKLNEQLSVAANRISSLHALMIKHIFLKVQNAFTILSSSVGWMRLQWIPLIISEWGMLTSDWPTH